VKTTTILLIKVMIHAAHTMINSLQLADYMTQMISSPPENAAFVVEEAPEITQKYKEDLEEEVEDLMVKAVQNLSRDQNKTKENGTVQWAHSQQELEPSSSNLLLLEKHSQPVLESLSSRSSSMKWIQLKVETT
jgi:hypothetical protein